MAYAPLVDLTVDCTVEGTGPSSVNVLSVAGELDVHTAPPLRTAVEKVPPTGRLLLDLSGLTFMDSSGLGVLVLARRQVGEANLAVVLTARAALKVLTISGLHKSLRIYDTRTEALQALQAVPDSVL